jgi:thiamine-phosphate pyrophosphorylase
MKPLSQCRLYTFVDTSYLHGRKPGEVAEQLCDGGSDLLQLRAKSASVEDIRRMAQEILPITSRAGVNFVINDYPELAVAIGAPLCHLGQEDFFGRGHSEVGQLLPPGNRLRIGLSSHAPTQAAKAVAAGAAYLAVGPIFATGTKPTATPVTLDYARWAARNVNIPWFAIGGVNLENLDAVLGAGARRICVVSAILNAPDVAKACQKFKDRLTSVPL